MRRSTLREMHAGQRWARNDQDPPVARNTDDGLVLGAASYGFGWLSVRSCTDDPRVQHGGFEPGYFGWVVLNPLARVGFRGALDVRAGRPGVPLRSVRDPPRRRTARRARRTAPPRAGAGRRRDAQLLERWSPALFESTFDPDSARYSWNEGLRGLFERLGRDHGRCRPAGALDLYGPLHGEQRLACERGAIALDLLLSPATPPRLQHVGIKEELPPDGVAKAGAKAIAAAIGGPRQSGPAVLAATDWTSCPSPLRLDQVRTWRTLRRLALTHSACVVDRGWMEVTHDVWRPSTGPFATC